MSVYADSGSVCVICIQRECLCGVAATPQLNLSFQALAHRCLQTGVAAVSTPYTLKVDFGEEGLPTEAGCCFIICHNTWRDCCQDLPIKTWNPFTNDGQFYSIYVVSTSIEVKR